MSDFAHQTSEALVAVWVSAFGAVMLSTLGVALLPASPLLGAAQIALGGLFLVAYVVLLLDYLTPRIP